MPEMTKPPKDFSNGGSALWISLAVTYFHWKYNQLSSALKRFTVLFGMGRSGTTSVWPPGKGFDLLTSVSSSNSLAKEAKLRARNHIFLRAQILFFTASSFANFKQHGYRIKPHEQLVSVS